MIPPVVRAMQSNAQLAPPLKLLSQAFPATPISQLAKHSDCVATQTIAPICTAFIPKPPQECLSN